MDQQKLRTLVFEKTGVRIDIDDPIFALVALNEAVLAEAVERHVALLDDATADLADQVQALQDGGSLCRYGERAGGVPLSAGLAAAPVDTPMHAAAPAPGRAASAAGAMPLHEKRIAALAAAAAVLCALLVLAGQALLFKPAPLSAVVARELTPEQSTALRDADKLARIVQKLDAKTRSAIQSEMQKP